MDNVDKCVAFVVGPLMAILLVFCCYTVVVSMVSGTIRPQEQYKVYQRLQPETLVTYDEWYYLGDEQRAVLLSGNVRTR
jgi:hypothetical protein